MVGVVTVCFADGQHCEGKTGKKRCVNERVGCKPRLRVLILQLVSRCRHRRPVLICGSRRQGALVQARAALPGL